MGRVRNDDRAVAEGELRPMFIDSATLGEAEDMGQPVDAGADVVVGKNGCYRIRRC